LPEFFNFLSNCGINQLPILYWDVFFLIQTLEISRIKIITYCFYWLWRYVGWY